MKFVFVQKGSFPAAGPMIISALLKKNGHAVDLFLDGQEKNLLNSIIKANPDVVGIPCFTGFHQWAIKLARKIKEVRPDIITLLGGPHPTYYPDVLNEKGIDIIARGEAEYATLELMERLRDGRDISVIKNLWVKKGDEIRKNEMDCLPQDLDALPLPDREIYYKYKFLKNVSVKQFLSGRGCPFHCTFCANNLLRKIYKDKGIFLRRRSPEGVVREIIDVKKKYGLRTVSFTDDVFITDKAWLENFLPLYWEKIHLPFMCNVTANLVNEENIRLLKKYGCYGIAMGVESGVEEIRRKVMKKYISDEQILNAGRLAKKYRLVLKTYNILCLPGETIDDAFQTLLLNAKIKSDFAACSLLQPFPDYEITEYAKENKFLPEDYGIENTGGAIYRGSPILTSEKNQFINLQKLFFSGVKFPFLVPVIRKLIKFPPNFVFDLMGKVAYGFFMSRVHRLTWRDMLNYALHVDPYDV